MRSLHLVLASYFSPGLDSDRIGMIDPDVIRTIVEDYRRGEGPFAGEQLPINRAINRLGLDSERERALYVTLDGSINYQRDADALRESTTRLWEEYPWAFEPARLRDRGFDALVSVFTGEDYSFRFPVKDAEYWYRNAYTLDREYAGNPIQLFETFDNDAAAVKREVKSARYGEDVQPGFTHLKNNKKFAGLGGDKVGSLWLQNVHMLVRHLDNVQEVASDYTDVPPDGRASELVPIPVDVHIARVTSMLTGRTFDAERDRENIERIWKVFFDTTEFDPLQVDKPLWLLGRRMGSGGEEYLRTLQTQS